MKKKMKPACVMLAGGAVARQFGLSDAERAISEPIKFEQLRIDAKAACPDEPLGIAGIELEFGDRAGDVESRILAADEIMCLMMVERIGLDQPTAREP